MTSTTQAVGEPDLLKEISQRLTIMLMSASCYTDPSDGDVVTGYRVKTGAMHRIIGILECAGYTVSIPANMPIEALSATPSPISDQAAGEPVANPNYVALARDAGLQLRIDSKFGNPNYQSVSGSWPALVKFAESLSTAPTTGSAPLRSDEWADSLSPQWKTVVAASASPVASVLSEDAILAIAIDHGLGTAVVESIAKALLAASTGGEKS